MKSAHCHNTHQVSAKLLALYRIPRGTVVACQLADGHTGMCKANIADRIILFGGPYGSHAPRSSHGFPDRGRDDDRVPRHDSRDQIGGDT